MDRYNFRTTSLSSTQLTTELGKRGAQTFGTQQRKQQRLQRFIDAESQTTAAAHAAQEREALHRAALILSGLARSGRAQPAPQPELRRSSRINSLLREYLGY